MPRSENYSTDSVQSFKSNFREHLRGVNRGEMVHFWRLQPGFYFCLARTAGASLSSVMVWRAEVSRQYHCHR